MSDKAYIYIYLPFLCGTDYQFLIRGSMLTIVFVCFYPSCG